MKMARTVRLIDNVLEVLVFDVALATPRRRRVAALLVAMAGLAAYLVSGLVFTPTLQIEFDPISTAPYVDDATWQAPGPVIAETLSDMKITPARDKALAVELGKYSRQLQSVYNLLDAVPPPRFAGVPRYRTVRDIANLLVCRGLWRAARGEGDEAVRDWVASARLGLVMARGSSNTGAVLVEGMISTAIERCALRALKQHIDAGRLEHRQEVRVDQYLKERARCPRTLASYMRGERKYFENIMEQAVRNGSLAIDGSVPRLVNLVMPARHADRVAMIEDVRTAGRRYYDALLPGGDSTRELVPADLDRIAACEFGPAGASTLALVRAMFSRERAAAFVSRWVLSIANPNINTAGERIAALESEVRYIDQRVDPMDLEGI